MASDKQLAANRLNAQKCTGPTSIPGKAASSQNALKTGLDAKSEIIEGWENRGERDELTAGYYARYTPATEQERYLLDSIVAFEWLQRRYLSVEASLWKLQLDSMGPPSLGGAFNRGSESFCRIDRRLNSAHRNYTSAMKQLHALRAQRGADPLGNIALPDTEQAPLQPDPPPEATISAESAPAPADPTPAEPSPAPSVGVAPEALNPELVSFRTFAEPPAPHPIFTASTPPPSPGPNNLTPCPAQSDII